MCTVGLLVSFGLFDGAHCRLEYRTVRCFGTVLRVGRDRWIRTVNPQMKMLLNLSILEPPSSDPLAPLLSTAGILPSMCQNPLGPKCACVHAPCRLFRGGASLLSCQIGVTGRFNPVSAAEWRAKAHAGRLLITGALEGRDNGRGADSDLPMRPMSVNTRPHRNESRLKRGTIPDEFTLSVFVKRRRAADKHHFSS